MSRLEKHAWYNIIVLAIAWLLFAIFHTGGVFGLLGLWGFAPFVFYPRGKMSEILDERERGILKRSKAVAFGIFWVVFVFSFMIVWYIHADRNIILPSYFLPLVVLSAGMLVILAQSIAMLVLSWKGFKHAE